MNKTNMHPLFYLLAFFLVALLLGGADFLQQYRGVNPCPLCMLQRMVFAALGLLFLFAIPFSRKRCAQIAFGLLGALLSLTGIALAGRQVWLQYSPPNTAESCEASLQYMLKVLPWDQVMQKIFSGGSGCAQVGWSFLQLSLAQWSLLFFIFFFIFSLWQLRK